MIYASSAADGSLAGASSTRDDDKDAFFFRPGLLLLATRCFGEDALICCLLGDRGLS